MMLTIVTIIAIELLHSIQKENIGHFFPSLSSLQTPPFLILFLQNRTVLRRQIADN